jgi:hypothetical protein
MRGNSTCPDQGPRRKKTSLRQYSITLQGDLVFKLDGFAVMGGRWVYSKRDTIE